jgi:putative DNA primase/helicase
VTTLSQAAEQMLGAGMPPFPDGVPIADGRRHRYGKKSRAWYQLYLHRTAEGRELVFGVYGIWGQLGSEKNWPKITADFAGIDEAERERLQKHQKALADRERGKRDNLALYAARRALAQWKAARATLPEGVRCAYLERKGIEHENAAFRYMVDGAGATLVVPMVRYDVSADPDDDASSAPRRLVGLQKIFPDGSKRFNKGTAKAGASCLLGKQPKDGMPILFTEGVATGKSARMATEHGYPIVVCFDAGNIIEVARLYRALFPKSPFLFLADDDAYLEAQLNNRLRGDFDALELYRVADGARAVKCAGDQVIDVRADPQEDERGVPGLAGVIKYGERVYPIGVSNAGRTKANAAAAEVGNAWVCFPKFKSVVVDMRGQRELSPDPDAPRLTDFNDLHQAEGLEAVRKQILEAIAMVTIPAKAEAVARDEERRLREIEKREKKEAKEKAKREFFEQLDKVIERYVLIYPSRECWDAKMEEIVKLEHMGALYGGQFVEAFTSTARKRVVWAQDVVFDPGGEVDQLEQDRINLYRGRELEPDPRGIDGCEKLLGLLRYLCGYRDEASEADNIKALEVYEWVLNWLALPIQRPGAKMSTALVFHGEEEGTGKNLFFSALAAIYGKHGGFITQRQLESSFNTWQSAKLFMVANEVVTRAEMRHQSGYVRHLITEPHIWINPKMVNERLEDNHMNLVFLSNEHHALLVPRKDRRFVVIKTPGPLEKKLYAEIVEEIANGAAACLLSVLLRRELGEFHTHADPIMTQAKQDMIDLGLASPQLFWKDFYEGEFPLPYQPCLREDLYRAYLAWCARYGEKMPKRINQFIPEFKSMNGVRFERRRVKLDGVPRQRRVAIMENENTKRPDQVDEDEWISLACVDFSARLRDLHQGHDQ